MAKIMVVEDNALNIKLFCDLLTAHGHEATGVMDSREAMETALRIEPDLVITDIQLPYLDGIELMGLLKGEEKLAHVPIMAVTAYAGEGDDERIRNAGAAAYLEKPISVARFAETVARLLEETGAPNEDGTH
ncbi:response regulator [Sphingomicrobium lutaoense]|uniref:Two-component system cell cycle response regulator DivK n=1 Tax=Sphingomicrobium lutaoense TaxID=515949 RepID=A0A839Z2L9_9SPHN|nr:response regulator [Sphingomicrobium lutaoense]MBB3764870.1 two-component system cell cycle response regulator DivK [Sphingomicrobium lutaoense]